MLKTQEVVNFVNEKLNELGTEGGYSFDIHSNIGENRNNGALNGILYINQGNPVPIPNYVENDSNFVVEILVPSARANKQFDEVQNIVSQFSKNYNGTNQVFDDGKGLLNITLGKPENFNTSSNTGENVPLYFTISVLYTKGVKTSGDVHWLLENMEIPYLNDEIFVDREGNVNKQYTGSPYFAETKTLLTSQTTMFRFVFPFKNVIGWNGFFVDLLDADIDKEYELKYYDDYFYTQQNPYRTIVKVFKSAKVGGQRGKPKTFDVTFAKVDNGQTTTKYFMALIDNPFDNQTEDTMWFEDVIENGEVTQTAQQVQQAYFESKVASGCAYQQIKAPNLNSIDITSQIYPNNNGYDLFDTTNKNYAIIKVQSGTYDASQVFTPLSTRYFYYFVTNAQIGAGDKILFDLKLDTFQTYMFDSDIKFSDCYIDRASINRWNTTSIEVGSQMVPAVEFDFGENSLLYEGEKQSNISKRLVNRELLDFKQIGISGRKLPNEVVNWINQYVAGWVYIFVDPTHPFNFKRADSTTDINLADGVKIKPFGIYQNDDTTAGELSTHLSCLCYPIYKGNGKIRMKSAQSSSNEFYVDFNEQGYNDFLKMNNDASYILGVKISIVPPFYAFKTSTSHPTQTFSYSISGSTLTINGDSDNPSAWMGFFLNWGNGYAYTCEGEPSQDGTKYSRDGLYSFGIQASKNIYGVTTNKNYVFRIDNVVGGLKNVNYNPKLLNQEFSSIKITNQDADGFEYDYAKLGQKTFDIAYSEPITPDISRSYIRLNNATGLYTAGTTQNFTGTVSTNDNSLIRVTSAYSQMLAQQKNFYQQNSINRDVNMWQGFGTSVLGAIGGMALGGPLGAAAVVGTALTGVNSIASHIKSKMNENFTVDNLKNAPASIQNAKGNVFLNAMATVLGVYLEEYDILPSEKEIVNDYMFKYGFSINKIGNIFEYIGFTKSLGTPYFVQNYNKRHYFNYIQAQVDAISGISISNTAREDLRQRFAKGIRCWYSDEIQYKFENYEEYLARILENYNSQNA